MFVAIIIGLSKFFCSFFLIYLKDDLTHKFYEKGFFSLVV
jgi:hypothetical protein